MRIFFIFIILIFFGSQLFAKDACVEKILESSNNQNNAKKITKTKADRAFIFFDTSVNMEGFITPATSSYKLFISELVKKTPLISDQQTFHTYLQSITGINVNKIAGVTTNKKFYQCPGSIEAADCHKAKSKLSTVLKASEMQYKIAKNPISIIVTDLFLKVDELVGNDRNKLYQPLAKALKKGDAIGIFGIQSNYGGKIFGICPGMTVSKRSTYSGASSRPFFVILIGNKDIILNFKNIMDEQVLPVIGTEKVEFNLFTNDIIKKPYYGASWPPSNFTTGKGVFKENILEGERTDILQYAIDKKNDPLKISIDLDKIQTPYTLPLSGFSAITQTHIQVGNKGNCDQQWFDLNKSNNITYFAEKADNSNVITFDIFNKKREIQADENGNVSMQLNRNYNYIFQIDFRAENIADNNTLWMEDREWTFSCEQADVITDSENGRTKFPVLNLDSFSDLLKQVQKENFSASSISQLNLAVHLRK